MSKLVMKISVISLGLLFSIAQTAYADKVDNIVNNGIKRQKLAAQSQKRIDKLAEETDRIIAKYHQQRKEVEGLKIYNDRLQRTLDAQKLATDRLRQAIIDASLIERQIVPLMARMITGLEKFVESDLPFKLDERKQRIERIKGYLTNANISAAERFRQVLETYTIENNYGNSIDVYTDTLRIDNIDLTVNILQLGRTAIYFQTTDELESGYYNIKEKAWKKLGSEFNTGISRAIKVAQKKISPELMLLPLPAPEGV